MKTTISSKGQVVIPAKVRKELKLRPGQQLNLSRHGKAILLSAERTEFDQWIRDRRRRPTLEEPLSVDRSLPMPRAKEL